MFVQTVSQLAELEPYQRRWDELAGDSPFRSWIWLTTWWKYYGGNKTLNTKLVFDRPALCASELPHGTSQPAESLVAILPAYQETTHARGRVIRLLGDGEVCSEHLDLLCDSARLAEVTAALAAHFVGRADEWDALQFDTVAELDCNLATLVLAMAGQGAAIEKSAGMNLWSIALPASWEDFLAMQSKSHRKQLRQLKSRVLESTRASWLEATDCPTFDAAWEVLIDLHQRRRQSLGERGCFASPVWTNFHRDIAQQFLTAGDLRLSVLRLDGRPVAAEYHFTGAGATYAYQGGIDPESAGEEPGQLSLILCIGRAIAAGHERFELLRGDEPYKPHWRAVSTPTCDIQVISPRTSARWRHYSWSRIRRLGRAVQQLASLLS